MKGNCLIDTCWVDTYAAQMDLSFKESYFESLLFKLAGLNILRERLKHDRALAAKKGWATRRQKTNQP